VTSKEYGDVIKSYIRFTAPADIEGTAFLTWENKGHDDDQFLYLPALKRVRRIVASQQKSRLSTPIILMKICKPGKLTKIIIV